MGRKYFEKRKIFWKYCEKRKVFSLALKDVKVEQHLTRETTGRLSQLYELWVDNLLGFLQHSNEVIGLLGVVGREEGVGCARVAATPSSPDAVNIVL